MIKIVICRKKKMPTLNVKNRKKTSFFKFFFREKLIYFSNFSFFFVFFSNFPNFYLFLKKKVKKNQHLQPSEELLLFHMFFFKGQKNKINIFLKKSYKKRFFIDFKNYKEIFYPDLSKFQIKSSKLDLHFLPLWITHSFSFFNNINHIQTKIFPIALGLDINLLLCSPTGTGKTVVAGFCIMRIIINSTNKKNLKWKVFDKFIKILYIAPMKTLVKEIGRNFSDYFKNYGLKIFEVTGDIKINFSNMVKSNIIIGIPEKIELLSKNIKFSVFFTQLKLLVVDEIHILNEERGAILEKFLIRFLVKEQTDKAEKKCRILGLSATFPNFLDVGKFLTINLKKGLFYFSILFRKISLHQTLIGLKKTFLGNERKNLMNEVTRKKIQEILNRNKKSRIIVFVQSRKDTLKTACYLLSKNQKIIKKVDKHLKNDKKSHYFLNKLMEKKIGIHHAGLPKNRKINIEDGFKKGNLKILISTSTLAWGINLPASHVIIKGTRIYSPQMSVWKEMSDLNIIQMLGRAGRFSTTQNSEGIIITSYQNLIHYMSLIHSQMPIESQLVTFLPDSFNTECAHNRITDILSALNWFSKTYFFIRLSRFLLNQSSFLSQKSYTNIKNQLKRIFISQIIKELKGAGMLIFDLKKGSFLPTSTGFVASNFFINHQTIFLFLSKIKPFLNYCELVYLVSLSKEFYDLKTRTNEKKELSRLEKLIFFPVKKTSNNFSYRANILIQAFIGNIRIFNATLAADSVYIGKTSSRLFRAFFEIVLIRRWASLVDKSFEIFQAVYTQTWPTQLPLRALLSNPLDDSYIKILEKKKINLETIKKFSKKNLENILHSKKGAAIITKILSCIPTFRTTLNLQPLTRNTLRISLSIQIDLEWKDYINEKKIGFWVFLEDQICDTLVFYNFFILKKKKKNKHVFLNFYVPIFDNPIPPYYFLRIKCDNKIRNNLEIPVDLTCIQFPNNHPFETKDLGFSQASFCRIFSGIRVGKILSEYFETHQFKTFGFFYQIITYILKTRDHKILSFVQNKIQLLLKEITFFSYFSTKKKNTFIYLSSGLESLKLNKIQFQGCSIGITGISVQKIGKNNKIKFSFLKRYSFFILSSSELATIEFKIKNSLISNLVFVVDFFHLIGDLNFNYNLEYFCEAFIIGKNFKPKVKLIVSLFPVLNSLELLTWLNLKVYQIFSYTFQIEKSLEKKVGTNLRSILFLKNSKQKNLFKGKESNLTIFTNQSLELKRSFLLFFSTNLIFITFILPKKSFFFHKISLEKLKKINILKIFFGLKIGFLVDCWKFSKRRLMEENFLSKFSKIFFLNTSTLGFISTEKLSFQEGIIILNDLFFRKKSISYFFHLPLFRRCKKIKLCSNIQLLSLKGLFSFQLTIESVGVRFIKEKFIRLVIEKENRIHHHIENKFISSFYSLRLAQNPQFYGFTKKFKVLTFIKKISKALIRKFQQNFFLFKNYRENIRPSFFVLIFCFYFFPIKISKNLFSFLKKKISSRKMTNILLKMNEFLFFTIILKKKKLTKNIPCFTKNFFKKIFRFSSELIGYKNQIFSLETSLKRFLEGLLTLFKPKMNFKTATFLLELNQTISSNFLKKFSELRQTSALTTLSSFLFGKIHNVYFVKSIDNHVGIFYKFKKSKKNINFLKKWFEKIQFCTKLTIKITIRKTEQSKKVCLNINIKKILFKTSNTLSSLFSFKGVKSFFGLWWLLIGDTKKNSIYIITKIFIKKDSEIKIRVFFSENNRNLKIIFLNKDFPFLSKEAKVNLLIFLCKKS